jgi:cardiolipin synthase
MLDRGDAGHAKDGAVFTVAGNRLRPLPEGAERLAMLLRLIGEAQESVRLLFYIYSGDEAGRQIRAALADALARGVKVSLIVDGFGSDATDTFFAPLADGGAEICRFVPRFGRRYLLRNHQKLALADEERVIIGGFNVQNDYFGDDAHNAWRDLGLLVEGPAVARLVGYFDALSGWVRRPKARMRELRQILTQWSETKGPVRWLLGGPTRRLSPWALMLRRDLRGARRLDMISAYFAPNPAMLRRIEAVPKKGGQSRLITAAKSDHDAPIAAARHCYRRLLRRGVSIFEYLPTKLHTKLYIVDDAVHLGSANFDVRSLYLNLELMLRVEDKAFAAHMRDYFEEELDASRQITREAHRARSGLFNRIRWGLAYFIVAVLDSQVTRRLNFGVEEE